MAKEQKAEEKKQEQKQKKKTVQSTTKYKVVKIGFDGENPRGNIVLLSKKERQRLEVELKSPVKMLNKSKKEVGVVQKQFSEYIGEEKVCSLNSVLAKKLDVKVNDSIEITKEVTETEWKKYRMQFMNPLGYF